VERAVQVGLPLLPRAIDPGEYVTQPHHFGASLDDPKAALAKVEEEDDLERYRRGGG
jgi:hypothetical protein